MKFEVIPSVDIKDGKCVQLIQGVPSNVSWTGNDPIGMAMRWVKEGAKTLHLIDLDGAFGGERRNAPLIEQIIGRCPVTIQVGGGIRSYESAKALLDVGADRIILGTAAIRDATLVQKLADEYGSERIMVSLDAKSGEVMIEGWKKSSGLKSIDVGIRLQKLGAGFIFFTNIDVEGLLRGIDPEPIKKLVGTVDIPVIASGGVSSLEDLITIKNTGAVGAVVGTALYKGNFTLKEARKVIK
ncbi:MAG: 1-(5-phosphoribosyl)-5-[(5-phosphoribosylamino)methylideneamino]imidazole-4-carboxamide isomerase [Methanocellales archaeon]|nr:1-(5-phosphoribosyl)-5-[(5-phosphoribosylamino)methylideneamino]imidazole-4-carboxamide isomerase [Methanocellales archaeon]